MLSAPACFIGIKKIPLREIVEVVHVQVRPPRRSRDHPNRSESQAGTTVVNKQQSATLNRKSLLNSSDTAYCPDILTLYLLKMNTRPL